MVRSRSRARPALLAGAVAALVAGAGAVAALAAGAAAPTLVASPGRQEAPPLRVLSFNIRYDTPTDGPNAWPRRADRVAGLIRFHDPDVAGLQEALAGQLRDLEPRLPGWRWVGVGRDDGREAGEYAPIFYRPERLELGEHGTFWLSPTPEAPGSRGWDAALPRIVTWAAFRDRASGRSFFLFNTHFDHRGSEARLESARLLASRVVAIAGDAPALVTGDLNAEPESPPLRALLSCGSGSPCLRDARRGAEAGGLAYGPEGTYFGFEVGRAPGRRIDYVLIGPGVEVIRHGHLSDSEGGFYPSDHLPVLAELRFQPARSGGSF